MKFLKRLFGKPVDPMQDYLDGKPQDESRRRMFQLAGAAAAVGAAVQIPAGVKAVASAPKPEIAVPKQIETYECTISATMFTAPRFPRFYATCSQFNYELEILRKQQRELTLRKYIEKA